MRTKACKQGSAQRTHAHKHAKREQKNKSNLKYIETQRYMIFCISLKAAYEPLNQ